MIMVLKLNLMNKLRSPLPAVEKHIAESSVLARSLGFTGTPAFIVGDVIVPGMISGQEMTALIAAARAAP